jgi:hypothetical protein
MLQVGTTDGTRVRFWHGDAARDRYQVLRGHWFDGPGQVAVSARFLAERGLEAKIRSRLAELRELDEQARRATRAHGPHDVLHERELFVDRRYREHRYSRQR